METTTLDSAVLHYQVTNESDQLIEQFQNYLNKYVQLLKNDAMDTTNYDLRAFLCCYIKEPEHRKSLKKAKYHSSETLAEAKKVIDYLQFKLRKHTEQELFSELVIPFLQCARAYREMGRGFEKYLYTTYKFYLKRHMDAHVLLDAIDQHGVFYYEQFSDSTEVLDNILEEQKNELEPILDDGMDLTNPNWISGKSCSDLFSKLKAHERYILSKYYYENHTDKEIARMLPYNPKSIHRIRMRMRAHFFELYQQGELKWIRI